MKKIIALLLATVLLLSLTACGSSETEAPAATESTMEVSAQDKQPDEVPETTEAAKEMAVFEQITVVDDETCTIRITGIEPDNLWGFTLKVYLENKSAEQTFMYSVTSASVNNVMADPLFAAEVAPGKKSNETISFTDDTLESNGIGDFTDIALNFRVYDSNDWMADPVATPSIHVYPYGEENAVSYIRESPSTDTVLVDNDAVTVIVTGYDPDNMWGYAANLFIVNKTDTAIMVSADDVSVNGYMVDPIYADTVDAGKCAFSTMSWFASDFEDNGITDVESIELTLRVYDSEDWSVNDFVNEVITLTP